MPVQLPSLGAVVGAATTTARRFPLVLAAAVLCTVSAILTNEDLGPDALRDRLLAAASLGLPLFTALTLVAERKADPRRAQAALGAVGALALALVYVLWGGWSDNVRALRYAQLSVAFHLLVAFFPFQGRTAGNGFWQYNRALLERFITAAAASVILYGGLALALAAVDKLFGVDVPDEAYFRVWVLLAFTFNTWFFLGGVPADLDALEQQREYHASLRVFARYILVPLVSVYLVILTLYLGKVVVTWDWPSGWVGWLVSGVATVGILTLLLVHPIAEDPQQKWVRVFARDFWLAILPAVVMLWLALWQRVRQYGITEPRYFLLVLSGWIAAMAVYYSVTRSRQIRIIPVSLCLVALVAFAGPWSAYGVAQWSQLGRLRGLLERGGRMVEGRLVRSADTIGFDDRREISAAVRYLEEHHGAAALRPLFDDSTAARLALATSPRGSGEERRARRIVEALGVAYVERGAGGSGGRASFGYTATNRDAIPLGGFDVLLRIRSDSGALRDSGLAAWHAKPEASVRILRDGRLLIQVPLDSVLARGRRALPGRRHGTVSAALLHAAAENAAARVDVRLRQVGGTDSTGTIRVTSVSGEVLVGIKRRD